MLENPKLICGRYTKNALNLYNMDSTHRTIATAQHVDLILERLCHQIIEDYDDCEAICLIGIQPRGVLLLERLIEKLDQIPHRFSKDIGHLDITFYRDDFRRREKPLAASPTQMDFIVENKHVILIDDVLYTGRSVQAALTALTHYGRARTIRLLSLIDRRFNRDLPIKSDFVGMRVDSVDEAYVQVKWKKHDGEDAVILFDKKS